MTLYVIFQLHMCVSLLSLMCTESDAGSGLTLSPSGVAPLCLGDKQSFTCHVPGLSRNDFLRWNVTVFDDSGIGHSGTRLISAAGQSVITPIVININTFNGIISAQSEISNESVTLTSVLLVGNMTSALNGTRISCTALRGSLDTDTSSSTSVIHVVGAGSVYPSTPDVNSTTTYGTDTVTVLLQISQLYRSNDVLYFVNVEPHATVVSFRNSSFEVTLCYNTVYNVSIVASQCGQNSSASVIELNFVNCGNPLQQLTDESVKVTGNYLPALVGASASFSCPAGQQLIGPNATVCMVNGQWSPKPKEVKCTADCGIPVPLQDGYTFLFNGTTEGSKIIIVCRHSLSEFEGNQTTAVCNENGIWEPNPTDLCSSGSVSMNISRTNSVAIAVASSIIIGVFVAIVSSILFFLVGFFCGRFSKREKSPSNSQPSDDEATHSHSPHQSVLYEDILPPHQEKDLELKQNVAYGPLKTTSD